MSTGRAEEQERQKDDELGWEQDEQSGWHGWQVPFEGIAEGGHEVRHRPPVSGGAKRGAAQEVQVVAFEMQVIQVESQPGPC